MKTIEDSPRHVSNHVAPLVSHHRELSSSLASNLASARGIPSNRQRRPTHTPPQLSPQTSEGRTYYSNRRSKLGEYETTTEDLTSSPSSHNPPTTPSVPRLSGPGVDLLSPGGITTKALGAQPSPVVAAGPEDPFSRFYTTFGSLISTLSAPLAFAGLPLNITETTTPTTSEKVVGKPVSPSSSRPAADPELTRLFSRAALRAVREDNGGLGQAESFYVVPATGGTLSYANMLTNVRHGSNMTEDDDAEFVDASETPHPVSPGRRREQRPGSGYRLPGTKGGKTWEELVVENESLKAVALDLGDRLRAFELGAQKSSLALHASMRAFSSPTSSMAGGRVPPLPRDASGLKVLEEKIREMEEELKVLKKDNKRLLRENQKYIGVIERYRERWEMLKVGARERVKGASSASRSTVDDGGGNTVGK